MVAVGSYARGEGKGQKAEHHRQRGHQNGAQTDCCSVEGSFDDAHALTAPRGGIFGEQDGSLRQQADEHDEACLHIDVVLQSPHTGKEERTEESEGYAEDDGEGDEQTLVEGTEDEVDEDDADDED